MRAHPSVSVIDLEAILQQVRGIIEKASLAVQAVFVFTLAAGIAVLFAAVQSTDRRTPLRKRDAARAWRAQTHRVLGRHGGVRGARLAAGLLASVGASILEWVVATSSSSCPTNSTRRSGWRLASGVVVVCASGFFAARGAVNAATRRCAARGANVIRSGCPVVLSCWETRTAAG